MKEVPKEPEIFISYISIISELERENFLLNQEINRLEMEIDDLKCENSVLQDELKRALW